MTRGRVVGPVVALSLAVPSTALAHLVSSGLGPYYDGALHLLLSPTDLLGLIAVAMLAGLTGARAGRWVVVVVPAAWFIAGRVALGLDADIALPLIGVSSLVVLGALVAADLRLPVAVVASLGAAYAGLHGALNGSALAVIGAGADSLVGISATVLIVLLLGSAFVTSLRTLWARVAVRVAGSWVAAVGMLMIGWTLQGAG